MKYSLKNVYIKALFTLIVFDILFFEGRLVLAPAQRFKGSERVKFSMKNQKIGRLLPKLLQK